MQENKNLNSLHFGHLGLIVVVMLFLVGISWMKNPKLFDFIFQDQDPKQVSSIERPSYYTYAQENPPPLVAGTNTNYNGPSIINEDGSITPALDLNDMGEILGVTSEDIDVSNINVNTVVDSKENFELYINQTENIESSYINNSEFEVAISSGRADLIKQQESKLQSILEGLKDLQIPNSFATLHKLKLLQYEASIKILQNFLEETANPQILTKALGEFLQIQMLLESEVIKLSPVLRNNA